MKKYNLPHIDQQTDTVILANGEFPFSPLSLSILSCCEYLVCCDGAADNLTKSGIPKVPDAIVGDCDSLSEENRERFAGIIHRISEQETNDLTKSVLFCRQHGRKKITILGATGKREDHTIANISLLCEYMNNAHVEMVTDYGIFVGIASDSLFESCTGQQISLLCIDRCTVSSHNLLYPIEKRVFTNWWQATLNESAGNEFSIETDGRMVVFRAF
jgi:thiamine pyrophosphokinase